MQGDIQQPRRKRYRPPEKPKPIDHQPPAEPDAVIEEIELDPDPSPDAKDSEKNRKLLAAPRKHFAKLKNWWQNLSRKERLACVGVFLLFVGVIGVVWFTFIRSQPGTLAQVAKHSKAKPKPPTTVASPLTGVQVAPVLAARPVTGVMIENSTFARPQSGLQEAGVVIEAIAEGGITRFMALFQDTGPQYLGPVRSLRPYYIDFAAPFQASIVHVGGSPDALSIVRGGGFRDLDQFFNSDAFERVPSREAPHNVYTSFARLDALNQSKGYNSSKFTSWPRKADKKLATPTAKTIDAQISSPDFFSHYDYDPATNSYARSEGGEPHLELVSGDDVPGVQIKPKVVIALVMSYGIAADGQHSEYADTGTGTAFVFQDGGVTQATWSKADSSSQIEYKDSGGAVLKLNAGQTWLTLIADSSKLTYAP